MNLDFLTPIKESVVAHLMLQSQYCLWEKKLQSTSEKEGFPDLENVQIAIFGVQEDRNSQDNFGCGENLDCIRTKLYRVIPWRLADQHCRFRKYMQKEFGRRYLFCSFRNYYFYF